MPKMLDSLVHTILTQADDRFLIEPTKTRADQLQDLCPGGLENSRVIRMSRKSREPVGCRSLLIAELPTKEIYGHALAWAAEVRQALPGPETADLYLLLFGAGLEHLNVETIEADERFCRKLVWRRGEELTAFLARTFLASLEAIEDRIQQPKNPLSEALDEVVDADLLPATVAARWRSTLSSGISGGKDLAAEVLEHFMEGSP